MKSIRKGRLGLLALGANEISPLGPPKSTLSHAIGAFDHESVTVRAVSRFYRTPAFPPGAGPEFVNAAAVIESDLEAPDLLALLHRIEAAAGRTRTERWGPRTLDIDLLAIGDVVLPDRATLQGWIDLPPALQARRTPAELLLPHPRLQDRAFVLVPLAEIAPHWRHPLTERTVREMLEALPPEARAEVTPCSGLA